MVRGPCATHPGSPGTGVLLGEEDGGIGKHGKLELGRLIDFAETAAEPHTHIMSEWVRLVPPDPVTVNSFYRCHGGVGARGGWPITRAKKKKK